MSQAQKLKGISQPAGCELRVFSPDDEPTSGEDAMVMAPSLGWRFSGINSTMEALLPIMRQSIPIACCGANLSAKMPVAPLWNWLRSPNRRLWRIWHSRRNNDMLLGLLLRYVLRQKLILVWTSAAQRHHTWLTRFCYHRMDAVLATTQKAAGFLECPAEVSHHGVDIESYQPAADKSAAREEIDLPESRTIGVFGRVRPQKGTGDLIEAILEVLPQHPDWRVVFVGQVTSEFVPYRKQLEDRLKAAGLADQVQFVGFLKDFSELPRWYRAMDVVACVSRNEGFGVTCLEGMACGAPVLATEAGAWPDIITEGEDGWIAKASDATDLSRALRLVCRTSAGDLRKLGDAARRRIEDQFTIQHESQRVISLYERMFQQFGEADWKVAD